MSSDREEKVTEKDIKEWASSEDTVYKYKQRFKEEWETKLKDVVRRMMDKL